MDNIEHNQTPKGDLENFKKPTTGRRTVMLAVLAFLAVVAAMFAFAFFTQNDSKESDSNKQSVEQTDERYSDIQRIDGKHFYIDGVHTVVGEIQMPTPCDLLDVDSLVAESFPEQITLDFKVINNAEFCAQVVTPQRFKVSATASEEATFTALFNNRVVELNLIEAAPGETPEEFELFIKG